jgi:cysteine desulfurase/selenocysteine lyase
MLKSGMTSSFLNMASIRSDFPILKREVHGKRLVYLDNAATTQKPKEVIDAVSDYYSTYNSNIHRSVHTLAEEATEAFEHSRGKLAGFINAPSSENLIFTRNATEALNIAARCLTEAFVNKGDKIVVTEMEHHSNFVPWQQFAKMKGAELEIVSVDDEGLIDESELELKIKNAKIFTFTHMSNVFGTIVDVKHFSKIAHDNNAIAVVDGAQAAPHLKVDVQDLECDFYAISGHKMLGPTGVGSLYGKSDILEKIPPFLYGGDMIREVTREKTTWNELPWKFEAGTSNIADVIGFGAALDYLSRLDMLKIQRHEDAICKAALEELSQIKDLKIYGSLDHRKRSAVISFNLGKIHAHDIASILDDQGIAIRSGHHCAQLLMAKLNVPATSRASFYLYNDYDDIEALSKGLEHVKEIL